MSDLVLFLGSGVSLDSGMASVKQLTGAILADRPLRDVGIANLTQAEEGKSAGMYTGFTPEVRALLRVLYAKAKEHMDRFGMRREEPNYEDLYSFADHVYRTSTYFATNAPLMPFVEAVSRDLSDEVRRQVPVAPQGHMLAGVDSVHDVANYAMQFIAAVVVDALRMRNGVRGLDLVADLAQHGGVDRLHVFTTNHDVLVETLLDQRGISYADGFGPRDGDVRWFDITSYDDPDAKALVYKIHGSVNWRLLRDAQGRVGMAIPLRNPDAGPALQDGAGNTLGYLTDAQFLTGFNKDNHYHYGDYAELQDGVNPLWWTV